jgi:hypothetical protein
MNINRFNTKNKNINFRIKLYILFIICSQSKIEDKKINIRISIRIIPKHHALSTTTPSEQVDQS